ncbi:MAG: PKD domain-containing protein [Algoriphagus sp.]|nr:PKD domain-containing protein [Algoriphagus sp.]
MVRIQINKLFLICTFLFFGAWMQLAHAQVVIPRDGFPYCEPFTNSTPRSNTIFGPPAPEQGAFLTSGKGDPSGNGVLRLTNNDADQRGYIFVDLPFSSAYGIKTSFEYFAYNPWDPAEGPGDGFSFFLFNGNIDASTFEIGGLGGSLGYSPLRYSGGSFAGGYGLKGAYMGIGLDERGNWGNQYEGKLGGFAAPFSYGSGLSPALFPRYPNSIAIRGPVVAADVVRDNGMTGQGVGFPATFPDPPTYLSYPFIDGKILFNGAADGPPFNVLDPKYFLPASQRFTVGANGRITNCATNGYRKVFIDLRPIGGGNYTISMSMLVTTPSGPQVINIFNNVPYPYGAPQNLKVGFAAATGAAKRSIHEIRNVTVEVSSIDPLLAPNPPILNETVCFDNNLTFDFDVSLPADNQFIRCLQLYPTNPGPPNNSPNPNGDPFIGNCGLSGVCVEKCKPENKTIVVPGVGTFESILGTLTDVNFGSERSAAKIKFTPVPGFFGTHTIYYNVIDNYGLTSEARTVTVTVNPIPKIDSSGAIIGPTCNGQNDGSINNVVLKDLIPGYTFSWKDQFGNVLPASTYSKSEAIVGGYIQATVGVSGVNLGKYFLTVSNPATNSACADVFEFNVIDERGTPVIVDADDQQVCQGTPVLFDPRIDPKYGITPKFIWYKDNNKAQPILPVGQFTGSVTQGGITYSINANGDLTVTGLNQNATPYEYFVEVAADPSQNLCATPPGNLRRVQALVLPPLNISTSVTDDLCRQGTGKIIVTATGGFPSKTYSLNGGVFQPSNTFSNLLPGVYSIEVNAGTNCIGTITSTINGPASVLTITYLDQVNPSCGLNNGVLRFQAAGGTPNYTFTINGASVTPALAGGIYTISGLAPAATYSVQVLDSNSCPATFTTPNFSAIPIPTFDATDDVICPSEIAVLSPQVVTLSNATNIQYAWRDAAGNPLVNGNGVSYSVDASGNLSIIGLAENATPYQFNLLVTGTNLCNSALIPATVTVNPVPKLSAPTIVNVLCFSENTGSITLVPQNAAQGADYQYSINGGSSYQSSPVFNDLIAGSYDFIIRNSATGCSTSLDDVVITQPAELLLKLDEVFQPACGVANGQMEVSFSGGTSGYKLELLLAGTVIQSKASAASPTIYENLAPGNYQIRITDVNNCIKTINQVLINDIGIPITVNPLADQICEGDIVSITPAVTTAGNPILTWYKDLAATEVITSSPTPDANGNIFTIDPTTKKLTVEGLKAGNYIYYLVSKGPGYCPNPPFEAKINVFQPITATTLVTDEICFGAKDGTITVNATGADGIFEYSLNKGSFVANKVFSGLAPGTYTIDIRSTGNNGCTFQTTATIAGPPAAISINTPNILRSSCDLANGKIENLVISGGWGNYSVEWRKGSISGPIVPGGLTGADNLLPDTYFIIITDAKGCIVNFNFKVEEMPDPVFVVAPDEVCEGEQVVLTPVNNISGSADTELKWYKDAAKTKLISAGTDPENAAVSYLIDANGKLTISGLAGAVNPYTYYLEVVCTKAIVSVQALVRIVPNVVFETSSEACFAAKDGKIKISSGSVATFEYSIDGAAPINQAQLEALKFAPKTYTITATNGGLCSQSYQVKVDGPSAPISINTPDILRSSCGLSNGSIENLVISGGWGNHTVEWRKGSLTGAVVPGDLTGAKDLAPDTYFILITDGEGCPVNFSFIVTEQPRPDYKIAPVEICAGQNVVLTPVNIVSGSSGTDLKWYKDAGKTQPINAGPDSTNPAVTYSIALNGQLTISGLPGNATPYTFYLHVVCNDEIESVTALVRVVPAPVFELKPVQCFGANNGKINLVSGGDTKYTYSVDGGSPISETQLEALNFGPKVYSISVKNGGFCATSFSVEVLGPPEALSVAPLTQINPGCGADIGIIKTQISGGWAPYTVTLFKNGSSFNTVTIPGPAYEINDLAPGQYYLTVADKEGCLVTSNTITMVYGPTQVLVDDVEICEGEAVVFSPKVNPAAPGALFEWFKNKAMTVPIVSSATPDANGHVFQLAADGTLTVTGLDNSDSPKTYYVRATGPGVCPGFVAEPKAVINRMPALAYSVKNEICFGDQGQITLTGSAGNGTFVYSLDGTNWVSTKDFKVVPGTYTGYVRSGANCVVQVPGIVVAGPSAPISMTVPTTSDPICNQANGSISFQISGGYGSYSVVASRNGQIVSTTILSDGNFVLPNLLSGTYSFTIRDTNPDGVQCIFNVSTSVDLIDQPTPLAANDDTICEGEVASLIPTSTQTGITPVFTWYQNSDGTGQISSGTSNSITYQIGPAGDLSISGLQGKADPYIYYVKISGSGVCEPPLLPVKVIVYDIPNLRVSNPSIVCDPNGTVDLTEFIEGFNSAVYDYQILSPNGSLMRLDEIETVNQTGSYQVQSSIKGANCWSPNQRIQVLISDTELIPEFNYEVDLGGGNVLTNAEIQIQEPVQFQDVSQGKIIIWNWDFGDGNGSSNQNPTHEYQKKGTYTITLTTIDQFGCVDVFERVAQVFDDYVIIVPNAFTPDGLKNQYFKPQYRGIASMEFYIFNTWGELIFEANSLETLGWDGTLNGKNTPNGNYVYRGVFMTRSGEKVEKSGVFILIR